MSVAASAPPAPDRAGALLDLAVVVAVGQAVRQIAHAQGAQLFGGSVAVAIALLAATALMARRGLRWRDLGLRRPAGAARVAGWAAVLLLAAFTLIPLAALLLSRAFDWPAEDLGRFAGLAGNTALYLVFVLPVAWVGAAFGEELLFRGFIARRLADALGGRRAAQAAATAGQALLFALAHAYLGPRGMFKAGALGLIAGIVVRANGGNLWPAILAHGLIDTLGLTVLYLGLQPH